MKFTPIHFGFYDPDFFIERHDHINYFEAIIAADGRISYACPSHQQSLIFLTGLSTDELWEVITPDDSVMGKLMELTNCITVHTKGYGRPPSITGEQEVTLQKLFDKKLVAPNIMVYW